MTEGADGKNVPEPRCPCDIKDPLQLRNPKGGESPEKWYILNPHSFLSKAGESKAASPFNMPKFDWSSDRHRWIRLAEKDDDHLTDRWTMTYKCKDEPDAPPVPTTPVPNVNCPESAIHVAATDDRTFARIGFTGLMINFPIELRWANLLIN